MRTTNRWLLAALAVWAVPALAAEINQKEVEAIRARGEQLAKAANEHDAAKMAALFSEDATFISSAGEKAKGRMEIQRLFERMQQGPMKDVNLTMTLTTIRMLPGQMAFVDFDQRWMPVQAAPAMGEQVIHISALVQKKAGQWMALDARSTRYSEAQAPGVGGAGEQLKPTVPIEVPETMQPPSIPESPRTEPIEPSVPSPLEPVKP